MKRLPPIAAGFLALMMASSPAADGLNQGARWPTASVDLSFALSNAISVVVAVSTNRDVTGRGRSHISTRMPLPGGRMIEGGGYVTQADCRQGFRFLQLLRGKQPAHTFVLEYGFVEKSDAFLGPKTECPIPLNQNVILLIGKTNNLLKVLPDTLENRAKCTTKLQVGGSLK